MRWLVGDVQGCARELERLLAEIRFDPARHELWCLGDLVNRGPDSLAVLRLWRDVGGRALLGNHDVHALLVHSGAKRRRAQDTLDTLLASEEADALLARLRSQPLLAFLPGEERGVRDAWIVHAGLHPRWSDLPAVAAEVNARPHDDAWLRSPEVRFATRVRCCTADGRLSRFTGPPDLCPAPFQPWDRFYRGRQLVVHGHWAARGCYRGERTIGLDSGCVYGGGLSAWCQQEDRIVRVPSLQNRKR